MDDPIFLQCALGRVELQRGNERKHKQYHNLLALVLLKSDFSVNRKRLQEPRPVRPGEQSEFEGMLLLRVS